MNGIGTSLSREIASVRRGREERAGRSVGATPRSPGMRSLRSHLVGLVLIAMLPCIGISTTTAIQAIGSFGQLYEDGLQDTAEALTVALDREIDALAKALTVLALSPALDEGGDLRAFRQLAADTGTALGAAITLRPLDRAATPADAARAGAAASVSDGGPDLHWPSSHSILVQVPVVRRGHALAVLGIPLDPPQIAALLRPDARHRRLSLAVADGRGAVIGWSAPDMPTGPGPVLPEWIVRGIAGRSTGTLVGPGEDGVSTIVAFARPLRAPEWHVVISEPRAFYDTTWRAPLIARLVASLAALGLAVAAAAWLGRRLVAPLGALSEHAQASAYGTELTSRTIPRSSIAEFEMLRTSFERAETVLRRRSAAERMALQEARTGHELLASVVNGTADLIYVKDLDLCFVLANRAALSMGGEAREEWQVLGRRSIDLTPFAPARAEEALDREVIASGELRAVNVEWGSAAGPGVPAARVFALTKTPWRDADGVICGVVTVARDVTRQRAAEMRLTAVQGELLRASRLSAMGAMASGLAHELNQPLAAATNFLNAAARLLDRASAGSPEAPILETARTAVTQAGNQALRAGGIVRRLRDFIGRGEAELRVEDVADLIREACDVARADGAPRHAVLAMSVLPCAGVALADRTQLQQVLLNLIRNAGEALGERRDGRIEVTARAGSRGGTEIVVSDNGPGLSKSVADRLFQPFVSTKTNGMGIGLAICGTIVEGHGGRLTAEAGPAGGALFRIELPAVEQPPPDEDEPAGGQQRTTHHGI